MSSIQDVDVAIGERDAWRRSDRTEPFVHLAARLARDGFLHLPAFFARDMVERATAKISSRLAAEGWIDPSHPASRLIARDGLRSTWIDGLGDGNDALDELLYGADTMAFFEGLLGGPARHFDFTWARAVGPGSGTAPHCDTVFMGRGSPGVITMWTALVDIPLELGGLCVLPRSHRDSDVLREYRAGDIDTYCVGDEPSASHGRGGSLPLGATAVAEHLGSPWVSTDFGAGDVVLFGLGLVHASLDNHTDRIRLSCDSRYQLLAEPIDERWIGDDPMGHGLASQRPRIC